ncbi:DUF1190 domain-containing protein [Gemmata sp. JC717]|uniref:DUF1190 domain-containing protein n=1 Tax=Gemmata algarum TaxID=2975278 RepID=UPI0021BB468B|nr:DUF1190 domain-containing protein [Gemmata algarum]MDY3551373.1 DUF1190 domain-containing protein [Gemmata algarum]
MKRTKAITLTMLAGTAILLGGCLEDDKPQEMASEADCIERTGDAEACKAAAEQAFKQHQQEAPKFKNVAECEAQFGAGKCNTVSQTNGGGSTIMPMMTGFLLGRMLSDNGQRVYTTQPHYSGSTWTPAKVQSARPVSTPAGSPAVVRGGFGHSAVGVAS